MAVYKIKWDEGSSRGGAQSGLPRSHRKGSLNLSMVDTIWPIVRLHMANEATNGDVFLQPLGSIREILESAVLQRTRREEGTEGPTVGKGARTALYSLAIEYIPRLLSYMSHIKTNKPEMGRHLLDILCYLLVLDRSSPYPFLLSFSSSLLHLSCPEWPEACQEVVSRLCHFVLPTCLLLHFPSTDPSSSSSSSSSLPLPPMSMTSTLMIVLEVCSPSHHLLVADTLMFLKRDVCSDILSLIAHGTSAVLRNALNLLLHYWPPLQDLSHSGSTFREWQTPQCQNTVCRHRNAQTPTQASMLCLDSSCVAEHKSRGHPKLYLLLCHECHSVIHRVVDETGGTHPTIQIPNPLRDIKPNCEFQKMCLGEERQVNRAEVTCYDRRCTAIQAGQPIRMCRACHSKQHSDITDNNHIYQVGPPDPWTSTDSESSSTMLEAVAKLLQCSPSLHKTSTLPPTVSRSTAHTVIEGLQKIAVHSLPYQLRVQGSHEGIWLLCQYCTPSAPVSESQQDWLVHLSALVLDWLRSYHDVLRQVEEDLPSSSPPPFEETDTNPILNVTQYLQYFSNYNDISKLVDPLLISWLSKVASTNHDCLVAALQPHPSSCAQVGKLWEKEYDPVVRYHSSLRSLNTLYKYFKSSLIPHTSFMNIFNKLMPEWLDLLVQLRTTGKMAASLRRHYHRLLSHSEPDGLEMVGFLWERFHGNGGGGGGESRGRSSVQMQRALFWLQDLTRLKIELPYIHLLFDTALNHKSTGEGGGGGGEKHAKVSVASSFDEEVEVRKTSIGEGRKASTASSDSESGLVSEPYLDSLDTQTVTSLNSSLTRSILMLDIWLSQMKLESQPRMDYPSLKRLLVYMLQLPWGSRHSITDHHETTNSCLLCKATALWFSLASQLLAESEKMAEEERDREGSFALLPEEGGPTRLQQQRISVKYALKRLRRLTHGETPTPEDFPSPTPPPTSSGVSSPKGKFDTFPRKRSSGERGTSPGASSTKGNSPRTSADISDFDKDFPPAEVKSKLPGKKFPFRKMATVLGESAQPPVLSAVLERVGEEKEVEEGEDRGDVVEVVDEELQLVFQLSREFLKPKLHPEATHMVVRCLTVLLRKCHVLEVMKEEVAIKEARSLFKDVWKCLGSPSSFVSRSCVALLLDCLKFLNEQELTRGVEYSTGWVTFRDGLKTDKFRTVEKFCVFLEFMTSPEVELGWNEDHPTLTLINVQVMTGYSFCLAVQLLQDRTSSTASRANYCISNISSPTLKTLRKCLRRLFVDRPAHRVLLLHSLSLLNTSLPRLGLLSLTFIEGLLTALSPNSSLSPCSANKIAAGSNSEQPSKKESVASDVGQTPKTSISSGIPLSPIPPMTNPEEECELLQLALSLLLKYLANPESDAQDRLKQQRRNRDSTVLDEIRPSSLAHLPALHNDPPALRSNPVFHVFLDHIYTVLDQNVEFSSASMISFILNRLITCTASTSEGSFLELLESEASGRRERTKCTFSLGVLPPTLREPWLRVFNIILYKYIHNYQTGVSDIHHDLMFYTHCCLEIALNTIEAPPHTCPLLPPCGSSRPLPVRKHKPIIDGHSTMPAGLGGGGGGGGRGGGGLGGGGGGASILSHLESHITPHCPHRGKEMERGRGSLSPVREESPSTTTDLPLSHKAVQEMTSVDSVDSAGSFGSVFLRPSSIPSSLCSMCGRVTNEFTEEVITHCVIVVAMCCQRLPTLVTEYLVSRIIPALAKVVEGKREWLGKSGEDQTPGSAVTVSSNLLQSILTQFADRRLFIFLFGHQYDAGGVAETVFLALGSSLPAPPAPGEGEGEGAEEGVEEMNAISPITYFLQDAVNSSNFHQDVRTLSLVHLSLYVVKNSLSLSPLYRNLNLLESFYKKLRTSNLLRDEKAVHSFLRFIDQLLISVPDNMSLLRGPAAHSFTQSFTSCLELILCRVACPASGLFQLAHHWYRTFLSSPRDANKLALLYVSLMRQTLKLSHTTEILHPGTFVSLIQVLLLEESGYLGYLDGLSDEKFYAPQLRDQFEFRDLFINAIQELQWDFLDCLLFLDTGPHRLSDQYIYELPRLKMMMAQLLALRVQHGRPPIEPLRRVVSEDIRSIFVSSRGAHQRSTNVRWHDHLSSLHIFSWLLLGATCHNAVHQVYSADQESVAGGDQCQLLGSLDASVEVITNSAIRMTRGAMQGMRRQGENTGSQGQYLLFTFTAIWTHYMDTWEQDSTAVIVQFWENFVSNMHDLLGPDEKHLSNVLHNLNDRVVIPLRKCDLSSFTLLLPIWRKLSSQLAGSHLQQIFPTVPDNVAVVTMDMWCREMVSELVTVERENSPHMTTAL